MAIQQIRLSTDQEARLTSWLDDKLEMIRERRQRRVGRWREWRQQYEGSVQKQKNFPWRNASNVYVPVTSIIVDAIHANMMNRLFSHERIWDISALHKKEVVGINTTDAQSITWVDLAKATQDYLNFEGGDQGTMDLYNAAEEAILECIKLGTSIVYSPWLTLTQDDYALDHNTGEIIRDKSTTIFDGVRPRMLSLEDFLILPHYPEMTGPFSSPLIGHRYWLRKGEVLARKDQGWYRVGKTDTVLEAPGEESGDDEELKDHQSQLEGEFDTISELRSADYQLQDMWIKYPLKVNDREVHLFVTYHWRSRTVMRIEPWIYKTPPYTAFRYVRREGRFYGIGVPEMLETIQKGVNTSFNQAVDNSTIANMRCWKIKRNSSTARYMGDIFPGKKFFLDNMDDLDTIQLGEVYPSIFQVGLLLRDFAERRTGISDFNLGRESEVLGRGSTATTTMALLQEGARRFDLYSKDIRRAIGEIGVQALELIQQHKPLDRIYATKGEDGELVERALMLPQEVSLRQHLKVVSTSSASSSNKEVSRQNALTAFGMLVEYMNKLFELGAVMVSPAAPKEMQKLAYDMGQTGEKLMKRVLEGFDLEDIGALLPQLEGLLNVNASEGNAPGNSSQQGAGPNGGGAVEPQGGVPNRSALTAGGSRRIAGGG